MFYTCFKIFLFFRKWGNFISTVNSNFINIGDIRSGVNTSNMGTNAGAYRNISSVMLPPGKWLIQYCVQIDATSSDCRRISCINRIKDSFSDITTKNITQQNGIVIVDNTETTSYVLQIYTSIASNIQAGYGQIKAIRVI